MRQALMIAALMASACAYHPPNAPSPAPQPSRTEPAHLVIDFISGAGTAKITARVLNSLGDALSGQRVSFSTDTGTLAPTQATTDVDGHASTVLTSTSSARVTATSGSLVAESPIAVQPLPPSPLPIPPPVIPPPPPPPAPLPTPVPPPAPVLTIALECSPAATPTPTGCHVSMTGADGSSLTSTITAIDWDWGDGLRDLAVAAPPTTMTHPYAISGNYLVMAKATAPAGTASASASIKVP